MRSFKVLAFFLPLGAFAQPMYMIQDLGTLSNLPSCTATALSPAGNVTGYCAPAGGTVFLGTNTRGFLYTNGKLIDMGAGTSTAPLVPAGVNDAGVVVGGYITVSLTTGLSVAPFLYQNGAIQSFTGIPGNSLPFALNNAGQGVATAINGFGDNFFAFSKAYQVTTGGSSTALPSAGETQAAAFAISATNNWVAGASANVSGSELTSIEPTLWHNGNAQALPLVSGFNYASGFAVNDSGTAAGMAFTYDFSKVVDPNAAGHAVLFSNGAVTDLGVLGSDLSSAAVGINDSGAVVGFSSSKVPEITLALAPVLESAVSNSHAFVYTNGKMYSLAQQLMNGAGWQLTSAIAVNDAGQIAGTGIINQQQHAFLLTPVPASAVNSVVGAGLSVPPVNSLSANGLFTIFGTGFTTAATGQNVTSSELTNNALPTNLGNICVQGGTARWGLIFVSATQINGVADPLSTSGNIPASVITNCGLPNESPTAPVNVAVAAVSPQFLFDVQNPSGQNEVVAVEALTGARVGPSSLVVPDESFSPAHAGDILTAYGVSWGATSPAAVVGSLAPAGAANITADYTLTVGGKTAVTSYAGLAPTFAGLYQVNFTVPSGLTPGNQPIVLTVGGVPTPAGAFLAVQ